MHEGPDDSALPGIVALDVGEQSRMNERRQRITSVEPLDRLREHQRRGRVHDLHRPGVHQQRRRRGTEVAQREHQPAPVAKKHAREVPACGRKHVLGAAGVKRAPVVLMEGALAGCGARRPEMAAVGQRLERPIGADDGKDPAARDGFGDLWLDLDIPPGAAALAGMSASI